MEIRNKSAMNATTDDRKKLLLCILGGFASLIVLVLGALALNGLAIQVGKTTAAWMAVAGFAGTISSLATLYSHRKP
ncbi:MAG TPA: hypothetical protein VFX97_17340 [Pyrinomonadaceae bacterium]|nr:hypothetical protein [Pyrinomonadaceae bacterium]